MPASSAVTRQAAQPSPNSRKDSATSTSAVSCMCRVQSSRFTTSTRAAGSASTAAWAMRSAGTAAEQPMKPTRVRCTSPRSPSRAAISWSSPGATKPVQEATTRWVIRAASSATSSAASASAASPGACSS